MREEDLTIIKEIMESAGTETDARKSGRLLAIVGKKSGETESEYYLRLSMLL